MSCKPQIFIAAIMAVVVLGLGCSSGQGPLAPSNLNEPNSITGLHESTQTKSQSQTHLWGLYDISIDPNTREVTVIPNRQAMFTANVVNFLNGKISNVGIKLNNIVVASDYTDVDVDVTLKHPFPGMHQYDGYDVRGVFMGDGSATLGTGNVAYAVQGTDQTMFPNPIGGNGGPDGYTRWYNYTEFSTGGMPLFQYTPGKLASAGFKGTASLNPYKYFADNLQVNGDLWSFLGSNAGAHGVFSSGTANSRNYYLRFPKAKGVTFGYAVIANWKGTKPEEHPSNAPESVACSVADNSNVFDVDPSSNGGHLKLDISLWNWGGQLSAGVMDEYKIVVESSVLNSPYISTPSDMTPIGGDVNFSTYRVDIPADAVKGLNNNEYWVIVQEKDWDYTNPYGIANLADGSLSAYFRYGLTVLDHSPDCPPPHPTDITGSPATNVGPVTCTITSTNLMGTTGLAVYLDSTGELDGTYDIPGTDIKNVNVAAGTFDATFDLTGVDPNCYYVIVTNACGETGASDDTLFCVNEYLVGDIYVSNHHDFDGLPEEGTMEHPFHTIQAGIMAGQQNNLILVDYGLGTYPEHVVVGSGDRYLTLRAYNWHSPKGRPCIDGPAVDYDSPTFIMQFVKHMTIQGFKFAFGGADPGWSCMLEEDWCSDITLKDCYFTGDVPDLTHTLVEAIQIYWTTDCVVENCLFKNINAGNIMGAWPFDTLQTYAIGGGWNINLEIKQTEFTDIQNLLPTGSWVRVVAIHLDFDWGGMNVHNNLIHHLLTQDSPDTTGMYVYAIQNNEPLENSNPSNGMGSIDHNTIDGISTDGFMNTGSYGGDGIDSYNYTTSTFQSNIDVHSNLVTNMKGGASQQLAGIADNMQADYNDIWNVLDGTTPKPWSSPSDEGVFNIYVDPMYLDNDSAPYNYHLQNGSPADGTGKDGTDMGCYGNLASGQKVGLLTPEN